MAAELSRPPQNAGLKRQHQRCISLRGFRGTGQRHTRPRLASRGRGAATVQLPQTGHTDLPPPSRVDRVRLRSVSHGRSIEKAHRETHRRELHCARRLTLLDPGHDIAVEEPKY